MSRVGDIVADPSAQLAPNTAYEHPHVARVAVVLPEDLGGELMLPRCRLRRGELAQVRKRHPGARGDLSERELRWLVPVVADTDANPGARRDIESGGARAHDLVTGLVALDRGDDIGGAPGALVDLALQDGAVARGVGAVVGQPGDRVGVAVLRGACWSRGRRVSLRRTWAFSLCEPLSSRLVRPRRAPRSSSGCSGRFPGGLPLGNRESRGRAPPQGAGRSRGATKGGARANEPRGRRSHREKPERRSRRPKVENCQLRGASAKAVPDHAALIQKPPTCSARQEHRAQRVPALLET